METAAAIGAAIGTAADAATVEIVAVEAMVNAAAVAAKVTITVVRAQSR